MGLQETRNEQERGALYPLPWRCVRTETVCAVPPWLSVEKDALCLPSGRLVQDYYRIETPDYVIMAVEDLGGRFLLERMYRHGAGRVILTSPSGGVEPGETPLMAARRELLEETGFTADEWTAAGSFWVDGTRGICRAHLFHVSGLWPACQPAGEEMEACALEFLSPLEIAAAMQDGTLCLLPDLALFGMVLGPFFGSMGQVQP